MRHMHGAAVQQQGGLSAPWATTEQPAAAAQTKGNLSAPWATNEPPAAAPRKDSRPAPWATNEPQAHAREPLMSRNKSKREQEGAGKVGSTAVDPAIYSTNIANNASNMAAARVRNQAGSGASWAQKPQQQHLVRRRGQIVRCSMPSIHMPCDPFNSGASRTAPVPAPSPPSLHPSTFMCLQSPHMPPSVCTCPPKP
mmetsp:Transcript_15975/g.47390  ORF Transcript_15975/g.47390 Transcript_15975/m.47390 type:complete len:197 (-) Transcript_15975:610-1200(-)